MKVIKIKKDDLNENAWKEVKSKIAIQVQKKNKKKKNRKNSFKIVE